MDLVVQVFRTAGRNWPAELGNGRPGGSLLTVDLLECDRD